MATAPVLVALICLFSLVLAQGWTSRDDPFSTFDNQFTASFQNLPLQGSLKKTPWSDTYWPSFQGGVSNRWQLKKPNNFNYKLANLTKLKTMSAQDITVLSPAEKFDIWNRRYDYPTVVSEWQRCSPNDQTWEGLCHGWAPASLAYEQPQPVTLTNADGVSIPFGSSDIKAMLTYYFAQYQDENVDTAFTAGRCEYDIQQQPAYANTSDCWDINAGTYHILLANILSNSSAFGFVADIDRSIQVWNQPIFKYESELTGVTRKPSNGSAKGTVKEVQVSTSMYYGKECYPQWDAIDTIVYINNYTYWLELDANNNILGGTFTTWDRVDFVWAPREVLPFTGYFSSLAQIYSAATNQTAEDSRDARLASPLWSRMERYRRNAELTTLTATSKSGRFSTPHPYRSNWKHAWSLPLPKSSPSSNSVVIELNFERFETERLFDTVKVFENADGTGPLIATLHGVKQAGETVRIVIDEQKNKTCDGVMITFGSDAKIEKYGFDATYTVSYM